MRKEKKKMGREKRLADFYRGSESPLVNEIESILVNEGWEKAKTYVVEVYLTSFADRDEAEIILEDFAFLENAIGS